MFTKSGFKVPVCGFYLFICLITHKIFQFVLIVFFWRVEFARGAPPFVRERCAGFFFFPLFSSAADLFMNLGMCGFEVKPGDAVEKEANGDKTPPVGPSECTAARRGITIIITPLRTPRGGERCRLLSHAVDASLSCWRCFRVTCHNVPCASWCTRHHPASPADTLMEHLDPKLMTFLDKLCTKSLERCEQEQLCVYLHN